MKNAAFENVPDIHQTTQGYNPENIILYVITVYDKNYTTIVNSSLLNCHEETKMTEINLVN
jgi:hypothetical protein